MNKPDMGSIPASAKVKNRGKTSYHVELQICDSNNDLIEIGYSGNKLAQFHILRLPIANP